MSAVDTTSPPLPARVEPLLAVAIVCYVAIVFAESFRGLAAIWAGLHIYSHGFLTAPLIPVLIWRQRDRLRPQRSVPIIMAAAGLAVAAALVAFATLAAVNLAVYIAIPVIAWLAVLAVLGQPAARAVALPVSMLYFSMPIWLPLAAPLQRVTAWVSSQVVGAFGIPVLLRENLITVPAGTFQVAQGCSGLNFLVVSLTIAALVGHLYRWPAGRRVTLFLIATALSMVANWVRVVIIIVAASVTSLDSWLVRDHYYFGWGLFAVFLGLLFVIVRRLDVPTPTRSATPPEAAAVVPRATLGSRLLVASVLVLAGPLWAHAIDRAATRLVVDTVAPPSDLREWIGPRPAMGGWKPSFPGAASSSLVEYSGVDGQIELLQVAYSREARGRKLIGEDSHLEGGTDWRVVSDRKAPVGRYAASVAPRERIVLAPDGYTWLLVYWYEVDGIATSDAWRVKFGSGLRMVRGPGVSRLTALVIRCRMDCSEAAPRREVASFIAAWNAEHEMPTRR